jgi:parvulin-like peptidyl-prolyl isomerase
VSHVAAEGHVDLAAHGEVGSSAQGGNDNDNVLITGGDVQMHGGTHHFGHVDLALDAVGAQNDMLGTNAQQHFLLSHILGSQTSLLLFAQLDADAAALNSVLADYGVNFDMMRLQYTNKIKISSVQNYLYTLLGDNIKEAYLNENYLHFQQIFLAAYHYEYETDKNGDEIYYGSDGKPLYKETAFHETVNGVTVYYTDSSKSAYSYDTENGERSPKINEEGNDYSTIPMTGEELTALENRASILSSQLQGASVSDFASAALKESDDKTAAKTYTDGYYLNKNAGTGTDYASAYSTLLSALSDMKTGEVKVVKTENGYHIVLKLDHTKKAYEKEENQVWFEDFASGLAYKNYREECLPYLSMITVDEDILKQAKDMKQVPVNHFYY